MSQFFNNNNKNKNHNKFYDQTVNKNELKQNIENIKKELKEEPKEINFDKQPNELKQKIEDIKQEFISEPTIMVDKEPKNEPVMEEYTQEVNKDFSEDENIAWKYAQVVGCNKLNFRKGPSKNSDIIGEFKYDDTILFTETDTLDWFKVKDPKTNRIGYCMSDYIKPEL